MTLLCNSQLIQLKHYLSISLLFIFSQGIFAQISDKEALLQTEPIVGVNLAHTAQCMTGDLETRSVKKAYYFVSLEQTSTNPVTKAVSVNFKYGVRYVDRIVTLNNLKPTSHFSKPENLEAFERNCRAWVKQVVIGSEYSRTSKSVFFGEKFPDMPSHIEMGVNNSGAIAFLAMVSYVKSNAGLFASSYTESVKAGFDGVILDFASANKTPNDFIAIAQELTTENAPKNFVAIDLVTQEIK